MNQFNWNSHIFHNQNLCNHFGRQTFVDEICLEFENKSYKFTETGTDFFSSETMFLYGIATNLLIVNRNRVLEKKLKVFSRTVPTIGDYTISQLITSWTFRTWRSKLFWWCEKCLKFDRQKIGYIMNRLSWLSSYWDNKYVTTGSNRLPINWFSAWLSQGLFLRCVPHQKANKCSICVRIGTLCRK